MKRKLEEKEIIELKRIVNDVFSVDLEVNNRKVNAVDARKVYSKILKEAGYSYELIGKTINKDHSTVLYYIKNLDSIFTYDKILRDRYIACKSIFIKESDSISEQIKKDVDMYVTILRLTTELNEAMSRKRKIISNFIDYIEQYEKRNRCTLSIQDYRDTLLPLFNE